MRMPRWASYAAVATLAAAVYLPTLAFPFVFDDEPLIERNTFLREAGSPLRVLGHHFWHGVSEAPYYYRPVVVLSLALNGRMFGWEAVGFHAVNVLLHAGNAALVLALAQRLGVPRGGALLAAALFAVHPAAAWPVASIVARVDLLPALFVLLAWWSCASDPGGVAARRPTAAAALLTGICFLLALLCKESAVAFLVVPLLGLRRFRAPAGRPQGAVVSTPAAVAVTCAALAGYLALRASAGVWLGGERAAVSPITNPLGTLPSSERAAAALALGGRYLLYLVAPLRLTDSRNYLAAGGPPPFGSAAVLVPLLVLACFVAAVGLLWLRRDSLCLPLAFLLGSFLPASNLIVPIDSLYAQNFLYLPLVGLSLAVGDVATRFASRVEQSVCRPPRGAWLAIPVLAILAFGSYREAAIWRDNVALFRAWSERFPASAVGHSGLGSELLRRGEVAAAIPSLRRALAIYPANPRARQNLASALLQASPGAGGVEEAREQSAAAVALAPDFVLARVTLACALLRLGRPGEAEAEAREAVRLAPGFVSARAAVAEALFQRAEFPSAAREFAELAEFDPGNQEFRSGLIVSLLQSGDLTAARRAAERARGEFPGVAWFDFCLARVAARSGSKEETLDLLRAARNRDGATLGWVRQVDDFDRYAAELRAEGLLDAG